MSDPRRDDTLVVGTRGSQLARAQTQWVVNCIRRTHPGLEVRVEVITTTGDRQQDRPLPEIGGKGLFTEELERALRDGSIDLAVHSAKDLPTALAEGLDVLAYPVREDPRDAWVAADGTPFDRLPPGSVVGTTSLRRQAQLLRHRPDLQFVGLRGNIDTRIRKINRGDCAGAVLAMAGLNRVGLSEHGTHPFEPEFCLPAPGQGALALEGRREDGRVTALLQPLHDPTTAAAVNCERLVLSMLDAGCRAPVAILAEVVADRLHCRALVLDPQGTRIAEARADGRIETAVEIARQVVSQLLEAHAAEIITECHGARG